MRRLVASILVVVLLLAGLFAVSPSEPTSPPPPADRSTPVVRLHRGSPPVRVREPVAVPMPAPAPSPAPDRPTLPDPPADGPTDPPRALTLEDLDPEVRQTLGQAAMERLHELADACESTLTEPEDLGAFLTLDPSGVVELELRPIGSGPGEPIRVQDRELPSELVDCLDDTLWDQDWSAAAELPDGAELPIALTMRLEP